MHFATDEAQPAPHAHHAGPDDADALGAQVFGAAHDLDGGGGRSFADLAAVDDVTAASAAAAVAASTPAHGEGASLASTVPSPPRASATRGPGLLRAAHDDDEDDGFEDGGDDEGAAAARKRQRVVSSGRGRGRGGGAGRASAANRGGAAPAATARAPRVETVSASRVLAFGERPRDLASLGPEGLPWLQGMVKRFNALTCPHVPQASEKNLPATLTRVPPDEELRAESDAEETARRLAALLKLEYAPGSAADFAAITQDMFVGFKHQHDRGRRLHCVACQSNLAGMPYLHPRAQTGHSTNFHIFCAWTLSSSLSSDSEDGGS